MSTTDDSPVTLNDLKVLAAQLGPSDRVSSGEVGDVLSAAVAVMTHGPGIVAASKQGGTAVAEFLHDTIAQQAADAGHPEPVRGNIVAVPNDVAPSQPVTPSLSDSDIARIAAAITASQQSNDAA